MTKPSESAQHTEDPVLGRAVDAALSEARSLKDGPVPAAAEPRSAGMVLGEVQSDLAIADGPTPSEAAPAASIDDLDASLADAAAEATAKFLQDDTAALAVPATIAPMPQPGEAPQGGPVGAPSPAAATMPAPAAEAVPVPRPAGPPARLISVRALLGPLIDPLAVRAAALSPTARHTIGWAAVLTLINAAAVWTFVLWASARAPEPGAGHAATASHGAPAAAKTAAGGGH